MKADLCIHTLENALTAYPMLEGAVIHSDCGSQYTSEPYRQGIREHHIHQSMNSAGGRCHDNARCESMWARMMTELLYDRFIYTKPCLPTSSTMPALLLKTGWLKNFGTLLYVNGNNNGEYRDGEGYITIADLTESYIKGEILFDDALNIVQSKKIVYAKDTVSSIQNIL